ncbi:MAG: maltose ABC transporter substrate-binding protein [Firmicutes bacterium]|nr:maltose ABC transporter substrate-binding protein [Bacillota bacterium]
MIKRKVLWVGGMGAALMAATLSVGAARVPHRSAGIPRGQTITLWVWQGPPIYQEVVKLAQHWAKVHGDTVQVVNQSNNPNGFQFYATAARTGKGPDVVFGIPHDNLGTFVEEGLVAPVPAGIVHKQDYLKPVYDALVINGRVYSYPDYAQTTALYYNTKMIKSPPATWSQFVKDANQYGFMFGQHNLYYNYAIIGGMGGYVFQTRNGVENPNVIGLDNAGAIQGFTLLREMDSKYHWMTPSTNYSVATAKFLAGKIGMTINGPWEIPDLEKAKLPFSVAPLPHLPNGRPMTPFLGVITSFVNARSPNKAADFSLVQALGTPQAQLAYFRLEQQIPVDTRVLNNPAIQRSPVFKAFATELGYATPMPNIPQMQTVWSAMGVIADIINGKVSPSVGAHDFVKDIKEAIAVSNAN